MRPQSTVRVVFVCTGNTCRSPMAEAVFKAEIAKVEALRDVDVHVESAGLLAVEGAPAAQGALRALEEIGLSLDHRAQSFNDRHAGFDLILTMTESHKGEVIMRYPQAAANVYTLKEFARAPGAADIADPFGGSDERYRQTLLEIQKAVKKGIDRFVRENTNSDDEGL